MRCFHCHECLEACSVVHPDGPLQHSEQLQPQGGPWMWTEVLLWQFLPVAGARLTHFKSIQAARENA